jgi:DNA polymerase bacteriophage-type
MATVMHVDLETYSSIDLKEAGVYHYVEAPDFEILLLGYAFDDEAIQVVDLASGEKIPDRVRHAILGNQVIMVAHNANFERTCLAKTFCTLMPAYCWRDTMVHAYTLGLPGSLDEIGKVLKLIEQKDSSGKSLITYFCNPCKPTKANGGRTRNLPQHDPEKWAQFKFYNRQDVETERTLDKVLSRFPVPEHEQKLWALDQKINDRGVKIDVNLAENAIRCDDQYKAKLTLEAKKITGLDNPNSAAQLTEWLADNGLITDSVDKEHIIDLLAQTDSPIVKRMLELRQEMAKTSTKKYNAMIAAKCNDDYFRGCLQFYGANRTGRWSGRKIQVHNLPKNHLPDLNYARNFVKMGDFETLEMLHDSVPNVLSQLIRTAFIPSDEDHRLVIADFSAIEARIAAWLAGEKWRLDIFNGDGKIYEASASQMFKVPKELIKKGNPEYALRQKGKVSELALGYGGGPGALITMGALDMGLTEDELPELVELWRAASPAIVTKWHEVERAAIKAVREKCCVPVSIPNTNQNIIFSYQAGFMFIKLPSGRSLAYPRARVETVWVKPRAVKHKATEDQPAWIEQKPGYDKVTLIYEGYDDRHQWTKIPTYYGKLFENIDQAVARDCLAEALIRADAAGYHIAMHVHDELITDEKQDFGSLAELVKAITEPIPWAPNLPLRADGFESRYYKKDD